jgi:uncharacterized protein
MRIEKGFEVPAAVADTYELLVDLQRVGSCIPGGEVGAADARGAHPASIAVRLGPMRMNYRGDVRMTERDDAGRRAVLAADVREQRGQGSAKATMTMSVAGDGSGSRVQTVTELKLTGRAAQMGRGVVEDVAERLVAEMAACIAARLDAGGAEAGAGEGGATEPQKPIRGFSLMVRVLWERLKRAFGRREGENHA